MIDENQRLDYLNQLGVVSWMPRQPLPGAKPSESFYHQGPVRETPVSRLRVNAGQNSRNDSAAERRPENTAANAVRPAVPVSAPVPPEQSPAAGDPAAGAPVSAQAPTDAPLDQDAAMEALAGERRVNRVPESLQLVFIRQQGNRPLIVSHFGEHGDGPQAFLPFSQALLQFAGFNEPVFSLPFVWPLTGMPPVCQEQEFVQVFRGLLGGARLGCPPDQECWWFGELPELLAQSDNLLNISLHYPVSLTEVMTDAAHKRELLYHLMARRPENLPR